MKLNQLTPAILLIALSLTTSLNAQVTIGSGQPPAAGALLDLKDETPDPTSIGVTASKGLGLPRVALQSASGDLGKSLNAAVTSTGTLDKDAHIGLLVYNTNPIETVNRLCPGLHVWDGDEWQPLTPYPAAQTDRTFVSSANIGFTHLDHSQPATWPTGKLPASYPLGYLGTFPDNREATVVNYHHTRYYVGYTTKIDTYNNRTSYACDPSVPNWGTPTPETEVSGPIFEDGVWMNENLRAEIMDPTRDKTGETIATLTGPDYNTGNAYNTTVWGYPNKQSANKSTHGLLYTWAAASNAKGGATGQENTQDEQGLSEGLPIQGVCPTGWHLPSDREYTDLENGIILHTDLFSSSSIIGTTLDYTSSGWRGGIHGNAMRPTNTGTGATSGTSKIPTDSGYGFLLAGLALNGSVSVFGSNGFLWSSSSNSGTDAWFRGVRSGGAGVSCLALYRCSLLSVRCKKN